jgi:hypothetical protein
MLEGCQCEREALFLPTSAWLVSFANANGRRCSFRPARKLSSKKDLGSWCERRHDVLVYADHRPGSVIVLARHSNGSEYVPVKREHIDFKKRDFVSAARDPSWRPLTAPLLAYLKARDRTIDDIVAWGLSQEHTGSLIRHMLAYLSFTGAAHYVPAETVWRYGPEPPVLEPIIATT